MASAAARHCSGKERGKNFAFFLAKIQKEFTIFMHFQQTLLHIPVPLQRSACVFELPLQRMCFLALQHSAAAVKRSAAAAKRCSASTSAALKRAALRISKSAALRCSAKRAAQHFEKVPISAKCTLF
jgi:hypothetical protein